MPQPPINEPVPPMSANAQNENTVAILKEFHDNLEAFCEELIEEPPAPAVKLGPKERYEWFMGNFAATYPGNPLGMQFEIAFLLQDDYIDMLQAGMAPPPSTRPFVNYYPGLLLGMKVWLRLFKRVYRQYGYEEPAPLAPTVSVQPPSANGASGGY